MRDRPADLEEDELRRELRHWGIAPAALAYAPVGFGDHHWHARDAQGQQWFLTVADLAYKPYCGRTPQAALQGLRLAMDTAAALREETAAGPALDFVLAPLRTAAGQTVRPVGPRDRYGLSVFPYTEGVSGGFEEQLPAAERGRLIDLLATLHGTAPPPSAPVLTPELSSRLLLEETLRAPHWAGRSSEAGRTGRTGPGRHAGRAGRGARAGRGEDELSGPYAEPARALVAEHAATIRRRLDEFDRLVTTLSRSAAPLVVTHGEPHPGNLLWQEGRCLLVDWDTVGLAVPERDLWSVATAPEDLARYADAAERTPDPSALALYRLRWDLEDLTVYLDWFRSPHGQTSDMEQAWEGVTEILARLAG